MAREVVRRGHAVNPYQIIDGIRWYNPTCKECKNKFWTRDHRQENCSYECGARVRARRLANGGQLEPTKINVTARPKNMHEFLMKANWPCGSATAQP